MMAQAVSGSQLMEIAAAPAPLQAGSPAAGDTAKVPNPDFAKLMQQSGDEHDASPRDSSAKAQVGAKVPVVGQGSERGARSVPVAESMGRLNVATPLVPIAPVSFKHAQVHEKGSTAPVEVLSSAGNGSGKDVFLGAGSGVVRAPHQVLAGTELDVAAAAPDQVASLPAASRSGTPVSEGSGLATLAASASPVPGAAVIPSKTALDAGDADAAMAENGTAQAMQLTGVASHSAPPFRIEQTEAAGAAAAIGTTPARISPPAGIQSGAAALNVSVPVSAGHQPVAVAMAPQEFRAGQQVAAVQSTAAASTALRNTPQPGRAGLKAAVPQPEASGKAQAAKSGARLAAARELASLASTRGGATAGLPVATVQTLVPAAATVTGLVHAQGTPDVQALTLPNAAEPAIPTMPPMAIGTEVPVPATTIPNAVTVPANEPVVAATSRSIAQAPAQAQARPVGQTAASGEAKAGPKAKGDGALVALSVAEAAATAGTHMPAASAVTRAMADASTEANVAAAPPMTVSPELSAAVSALTGAAPQAHAPAVQSVTASAPGFGVGGGVPVGASGMTQEAGGQTGAASSGGLAHSTLNATPTSLEVGVSSGTHGWLKIRAELAGNGEVNASLTGGSTVAASRLRSELPALSSYLQAEKVMVGALAVHAAPVLESAALAAGTGGSGRSPYEASGGPAAGADGGGGAGARSQGGEGGQGSVPLGASSSVAAGSDESLGRLAVRPPDLAGYGRGAGMGGVGSLPPHEYGAGGGWLNVRA